MLLELDRGPDVRQTLLVREGDMLHISSETLRELDARELAVCRAGSALDTLEASHIQVSPDAYRAALMAWKTEIRSLTEVREAILITLSGA